MLSTMLGLTQKAAPERSQLDDILEANEMFVDNCFIPEFHATLPPGPVRQISILTCMDPRINPFHAFGLKEGDAHIIRNGGGRATNDAIRSLVASYKLLGSKEFFVIHHTDCGFSHFNNDQLRDMLEKSLDPCPLDWKGRWMRPWTTNLPGSVEGRYIEFLPITNVEESVRQDVQRLRDHPLINPDILIHGLIYDVKTGKLSIVNV